MYCQYLFKEIDRSTEPPELLKEESGSEQFGVKTGEGFYSYPGDKTREGLERDRQFLQRLKCLYPSQSEKTP